MFVRQTHRGLGKSANLNVQTYIGHVLVSVNPFRDRELAKKSSIHELTEYSWHIYGPGIGFLQRSEQAGSTSPRFRRRRIFVLQHESIQGQSMCDHIRRVGRGKD
jgi:hypothetical protein